MSQELKADLEQVKTEILQALRAKRSQRKMDQKLGHPFGHYHRWESGSKRLLWSEFVEICQGVGLDLGPSLKKTVSFNGNPEDFGALVTHIIGPAKLQSLAKRLGVSRYHLSRWSHGQTCPTLENVLHLINHCQFVLLEVVSSFVDLKKVPTLYLEWSKRQEERQLHYEYPSAGAVLRGLELEAYIRSKNHDEQLLSKKLSLDLKEIKDVLGRLEALEKIKKNEKGKYLSLSKTLDTRGDFKGSVNLRRYWTKRALKRLEEMQGPPARDLFGYEVFCAGPEAMEKIREEYMKFYYRVRAIITAQKEASEADAVFAMNIQIFDLQGPATYDASH